MQLDLSPLVHLIDGMPAYQELLRRLRKKGSAVSRVLVLDAAKPYLTAAVYQSLQLPMLVVTAQPENAKKLYEQISLWSNSRQINLFPEPDILPYQRTIPDSLAEQERIQVLYSLSGMAERKAPPLIIVSAPALIQKTISRDEFASAVHTIEVGNELDPLSLMDKWTSMGYQVDTLVEAPGRISRRGGIIDIFPPTSDLPVRLEFFGNTVESIRLFDPSSQRSQKVIHKITICPATEILPLKNPAEIKSIFSGLNITCCSPESRQQYEQEIALISSGQRPPSFYAALFNNGNLLDYLPPEALVILDESPAVNEEIKYLDMQAVGLRQEKIEAGDLPDNFPVPYFKWEEIAVNLKDRPSLDMLSWTGAEDPGLLMLDFNPAPSYTGQLPTLIKKTGSFLGQGRRLIIISNQVSRLSELMEEEEIFSRPMTEIVEAPPPGSLTLLQGSLEEGWQMGGTYLLTDKEVFGFVKERRLPRRRPIQRHKLLVDIKPGDYVVHIEHGIGQFMGVTNISTDSTQREYLVLTYAAGDKLYVPTDQIDRVGRYIGSGEDSPTLSRLGTQEWNRTKQKVKESVEEIAYDLLQLYAAREVLPGHPFTDDTVWQQELEASFPYIETPDQMKVQQDVKEDMARAKPMDRLVIGDVGYGKTEIAIRAAFKSVMDNKQVAVLVPTTVLAEQHYLTFKQRMGAFPVKIDVLSRFRKPKEQQKVIKGLADGSIDICIGTHRLLQKDVVFKDLGLIVIDEEQRFGVFHKEHLKKLREQVDVLTLSATPIPRTLHMSLVGVRD
ncbi:MAG: CarD family transcriptional regulator, partial [Dehalococcoidales bacterium]|nr:CarD family transcriptional regulator [Dehalococcoidales bacterium]